MTAKPDATGSDGPEAGLPRGAPGGDPLAIFQLEESGDGAALRMDAIPSQAPSVPLATPSVNDGKPPPAVVLNRINGVFQTLDIACGSEKTAGNGLAALHEQDLQAIETAVAALESRAQTVSTSLRGLMAACEAREAAVVDTVEQLRRRAADIVDDLEGRVEDCEARAHIAGQTITRLYDVSSRTLPALAVPQIARQLDDFNASAEQQVRALAVQQIERLPTAAQGETEKLNGLRRRGGYQGGHRARLIFSGAAFALSAAIIFLIGIVWRISPVENHRAEQAPPAPVLASRALTLASTSAVAPAMPLTADIGHDRPEATRAPPAVPAVAGPPVIVSTSPVATTGVPTATVRKQAVSKGQKPPRFVGTLIIESDPAGAAAFVNQEPVGDTPVLLKDLRVGSYVVRLEYEGYQRWSTAATVSAVRREGVKAKLEPVRPR